MSTPPTPAIAAPSPNAYSFAPTTLMPSAAAARSFVRTATSLRPARPRRQVRDREREDDEADEREHRVPLRMRRGVEVEPEERDRADLRSGDAASASRVVEDQAFDDERESQGRDGEVHSSRSQRG